MKRPEVLQAEAVLGELLTFNEAANRLGVTPAQVQALITLGTLEKVTVGERTNRVTAATVDAELKRVEAANHPAAVRVPDRADHPGLTDRRHTGGGVPYRPAADLPAPTHLDPAAAPGEVIERQELRYPGGAIALLAGVWPAPETLPAWDAKVGESLYRVERFGPARTPTGDLAHTGTLGTYRTRAGARQALTRQARAQSRALSAGLVDGARHAVSTLRYPDEQTIEAQRWGTASGHATKNREQDKRDRVRG